MINHIWSKYELIQEIINNKNIITMYHVTDTKNIPSIKKYGLLKKYTHSHYKRGVWRTIVDGIYVSHDQKFLIHEIGAEFKNKSLLIINININDLYHDEDVLWYEIRKYFIKRLNEVGFLQDNLKDVSKAYITSVKKYRDALILLSTNPTYIQMDTYIKSINKRLPLKLIHGLIKGVALLQLHIYYKKEINFPSGWLKSYRKSMLEFIIIMHNTITIKNYKQFLSFVVMRDISPQDIINIKDVTSVKARN